MSTKLEIGRRISAARIDAKLTQSALGEKLGRTKGAISQWESGQGEPGLLNLIALCKILKVSSDYLLTGSKEGLTPQANLLARRIDAMPDAAKNALFQVFSEPVSDAIVSKHYATPPNIEPKSKDKQQ